MNKNIAIGLFTLLVVMIMILSGCEGKGSPYGNIPPVARLSNIPPIDTMITTGSPILKLSWVGDDPDGFITAFKYRWSYTITTGGVTDTLQKAWFTLLNYRYGTGPAALALMIDTMYQNSELYTSKVYKYLANLRPNDGVDLPEDIKAGLYRGDTVEIEGVRVYASNPDSTIEQATGVRVEKRFPVHENANSGTFVFDSQDSLNHHAFQIIAIDNLGELSAPAVVEFVTPRVKAPQTYVVDWPRDTSFVLQNITATFAGLTFTFNANDPNSRTREYQWVVDRDKWVENNKEIPWSQWSERTVAQVTARHFYEDTAIEHTFHVRARNEFGSIDTLGYFVYPNYTPDFDSIEGYDTSFANVTFYTIYPVFAREGVAKRTLLLNFSYEYPETSTNQARPPYSVLNTYYENLMIEAGMSGKYDLWLSKKQGFPGQFDFGAYSSVILFADIANPSGIWADEGNSASNDTNLALLGRKADLLRSYCRIGGNMIWSTFNAGLILNINHGPLPLDLYSEPIWGRIFHATILNIPGIPSTPSGFVGGKGLVGYPDIAVDPAKLDSSWNGSLPFVWLVRPEGFGERIYKFDHATDNPSAEAYDIGIRYHGVTFSNVYLGMPLYYMNQSSAVLTLKKALEDINAY